MSASLVRKGLDLFSEDLYDKAGGKKKKSKTSLLTTNKTGLKKLRKTGTKNQQSGTDLTVKGKKVKSSVQQYNKRKAKDNTKEAIQYLQLLSSNKTASKVVEQVTEFTARRSAKPAETQQKPKEQKSCFTEADFARFEKEYFVGPRKRAAL